MTKTEEESEFRFICFKKKGVRRLPKKMLGSLHINSAFTETVTTQIHNRLYWGGILIGLGFKSIKK